MTLLARALRDCRPVLLGVLALGLVIPCAAASSVDRLAQDYLSRWASFYPSRAFAEGKLEAAARFEDYSPARLERWLAANDELLRELEALDPPAEPGARVDLQLLKRQVAGELSLWRDDRPLQTRPEWYATQISQALTYLLVGERLSEAEKREALIARLAGMRRLCETGRRELSAGNRLRSESALRSLDASAAFLRDALPGIASDWEQTAGSETVPVAAREAAGAVQELRRHIEQAVLPGADASPSMGDARYTALLDRRSAGQLTPEALARDALEEVDRARSRMADTAKTWWRQEHQGQPLPPDVLARALEAMENDRAQDAAGFFRRFSELTAAAEQFVRRHGLATIPEPTTLHIAPSPGHFAGAAVGGVYPAGPYAPGANTLFYLPSIAPDASASAAEGFYRSFNDHFNTMIISHEMFPGHYLQYKVAVTHAPAIRAIFPDGAYVEGWGSFSEELMLEAGWGDDDPLTWLAHYRKRLENATRSYLSVMVHTRDWSEEQVAAFAVERGLLAPQFAINLWQRVVNSPLQLTDYFVGYRQFRQLWREQRARRGEDFDQRELVDAVLRAGPVPVAALPQLIRRNAVE